jgi:hypothetical protein
MPTWSGLPARCSSSMRMIRLLEGKDHWLVQYPAMPVEPEVKALTLAFFQKHLAQ